MENYTIDRFWIQRLGTPAEIASTSLVKGWTFEHEGLDTFKEAPLTLSTGEFGEDVDPMRSPILLVSAPGAVGKSTLARQIAFTTGSVYVDLAKADPVGGNTLTGGLARSKIYSAWESGAVTALIDGLDEANLKTTKEGFEAFLSDVAELSAQRTMPTVLFGRTGAVQDAWLVLTEKCGDVVAVMEIGYYDAETSIDFAESQLKTTYPNRDHPLVDRQALTMLLEGLRSQTASDGDRFAGYAPVLQAVAERVARENNPSTLVSQMQQDTQPPVTLQSIVSAILDREQKKLETLTFQDPTIVQQLYRPEEQLERLVARRYQTMLPKSPAMLPKDAETYSRALETWVGEHPFLDGDTGTSSAVFEAVITSTALKNDASASEAVQRELAKGEAANPFLYAFYLGDRQETCSLVLPEEHIGVLYSSIRASLAQGETASLSVEQPEDDNAMLADVEIELSRRGKDKPNLMWFSTEPFGPIRLGPHLRDVFINMPHARVEIGQDTEVLLIGPVDIQCDDLAVLASKVIADSPTDMETAAVFLQAGKYHGAPTMSVPVIRNQTKLLASWPGVENYPWNNFATQPRIAQTGNPQMDEARHRFRRFISEFRAHGKRRLARSRVKIENTRMTKGTGQAVLDALLHERILTRDEVRYYLNSDRLGEVTQTTYAGCMAHQFGPEAIAFLTRALDASGQ